MDIIDPELKYCPACREEYRAEIEQCASCKESLVWGSALLASNGGDASIVETLIEITADDRLIPLQSGSLGEIKKIQRLLRQNCIASILLKDAQDCGNSCCGPQIILHIREQDRARSHEVLRADFENTTGLHDFDHSTAEAVFDPRAAMTSCPACGHHFTPDGPSCPDCKLTFL